MHERNAHNFSLDLAWESEKPENGSQKALKEEILIKWPILWRGELNSLLPRAMRSALRHSTSRTDIFGVKEVAVGGPPSPPTPFFISLRKSWSSKKHAHTSSVLYWWRKSYVSVYFTAQEILQFINILHMGQDLHLGTAFISRYG